MNATGSTPLDDDAIEAIAAAWLAQRDEGFAPGQVEEFARWMQARPQHAAAVARLEATCRILEKMPRLREEKQFRAELVAMEQPQLRKRERRARRRWMPLVGTLAAALAIMAAGWAFRPEGAAAEQRYATTAEGYERLTLADGSVVELNANSVVRVHFLKAERRVALERGEAHFTVAKNPARPFIVRAGSVDVRAVGTAFNVRSTPAEVEVLVTEGRVRVSPPPFAGLAAAAAEMPAPELGAGQRTVIPAGAAIATAVVETVAPAAMRETLAWQAPRLVFVETPLREVIEQFNRRNRLQLLLGDADLANRPVDGHFRADNVEAFVRLLESTRDVAVERPDPQHIVLRKIR